MSRFEDTLVRDLNVIADRATPSPDAWDSILTKIESDAPTRETEIIMLTDNTMPTRRWPLVAAAAAVIALIVGAVAVIGAGDDDNTPAEPTPTVAPAPDDQTDPDDVVTPEEPSVFGAEAAPWPAADAGRLAMGTTYLTEALGVPVTLSVDDPSFVTLGGSSGYVAIEQEIAGHLVEFERISGWLTTEQSVDPSFPVGDIDPLDIDTWIDQADVDEVGSEQISVAGYPAELRDVTVRADSESTATACTADQYPCIVPASLTTTATDPGTRRLAPTVRASRSYRMILVDVGDPEPVLILVSSVSSAWVRGAGQDIVDGVEFGPVAPISDLTPLVATVETIGESSGSSVPPGRYVVDALGRDVRVDIGAPDSGTWFVGHNEPGLVVLGTDDQGSEVVQIQRIGALTTAEGASDEESASGSIAPDDVDGWLNSNPDVVVEAREQTTVDELPAEFIQVRLDPTNEPGYSCDVGERCIAWNTRSADAMDADADRVGVASMASGQMNYIWFIDTGADEPIVVTMSTRAIEPDAWRTEVAQPIVDSIEFDDPTG